MAKIYPIYFMDLSNGFLDAFFHPDYCLIVMVAAIGLILNIGLRSDSWKRCCACLFGDLRCFISLLFEDPFGGEKVV